MNHDQLVAKYLRFLDDDDDRMRKDSIARVITAHDDRVYRAHVMIEAHPTWMIDPIDPRRI